MKCPNCNEIVKEDEIFCKYCGKRIIKENNVTVNPNFKRNDSKPWLIAIVFVAFIAIIVVGFISATSFIVINDIKKEKTEVKDKVDEFEDKREKEKKLYVAFKGFTFTHSNKIKMNVSSDKLYIYGENNEWVAVVLIQEGKYETVTGAKDQIKTIIENQDASYDLTDSATIEKDYSGNKYLIIDNIKKDTHLYEIAYAKADENNLFIISSSRIDGTGITEKEREAIYNIISTGARGI